MQAVVFLLEMKEKLEKLRLALLFKKIEIDIDKIII